LLDRNASQGFRERSFGFAKSRNNYVLADSISSNLGVGHFDTAHSAKDVASTDERGIPSKFVAAEAAPLARQYAIGCQGLNQCLKMPFWHLKTRFDLPYFYKPISLSRDINDDGNSKEVFLREKRQSVAPFNAARSIVDNHPGRR
jgi:hypothetical protein